MFTAPAAISLSATASDVDGTIAQVDFYANGVLIRTDTSSPYSFSWTNVSVGNYSLTAVARDNVFGCQFHPEKSQAAGLALLREFVTH